MKTLQQNVDNREALVEKLRQEFIGPITVDPLRMTGIDVNYEKTKEIYYAKSRPRKYYYNLNTKDEIIQNGNSPVVQYSAGILFPYNKQLEETEMEVEIPFVEKETETSFVNEKDLQTIENRFNSEESTEDVEYAMSDVLPSSLAFTFYVKEQAQLAQLVFDVSGAVYKSFNVKLIDEEDSKSKGFETKWWSREPLNFPVSNKIKGTETSYTENLMHRSLKLKFQLSIRKIDSIGHEGYFITASLTNISDETPDVYKNAFFQSEIKVSYADGANFVPYPTVLMPNLIVDEGDLSNDLLYFDTETYALGHGCSVNWSDGTFIETTFMPEHEITNITPDITNEKGEEVKISMLDLAEGSLTDVQQILSKITTGYRVWIKKRQSELAKYPAHLQKTANRHMQDCLFVLERMEGGIKALTDDNILRAFQSANLAIFVQQVSGGSIQKANVENGKLSYDLEAITLQNLPTISELREMYTDGKKGNWRAFQIAFLMMSLPALAKENTKEREIVDLIWFPTGGGKTEAYLGVAATTILYQRLMNAPDRGTEIIMRYTLRLLTTDQFQRSARLICALELIRRNQPKLFGAKEISIGLWVGKSNTPNEQKNALKQLYDWQQTGDKKYEFLITHCPLCRCEMLRYKTGKIVNSRAVFEVVGYKEVGKRGVKDFVIHCPLKGCAFHERLPIYIIDEQLYAKQPTFIIGTVDKFAMLAWKPEAKSLFGIGEDGNREFAPPSLIIQDELHLISGPLGSIVGIYETLIDELCTDYRNGQTSKPKIICATATVKGYKEQIHALFARDKQNVRLFPSPGLSHKDSYFAQVHLVKDEETGELRPSRGRKYVGIASNLIGIPQIQVKSYTTVLQMANQFENPDAYWTLLAFYNSIRELGGSLTLFQTDISNYMLQFKNKHFVEQPLRYINNIKELTSRLENREVTAALAELKMPYDEKKVIDVCLASNIIEVGVDVERLSLMSIVGQPKNTTQYIQVSGRVGRAWYERPGLVMTLYKVSMSRDKSHFEHFKEYHQCLYKQVEATSITPFSEPAIDRALAGVMIGWLRQLGSLALGKSPVHLKHFEHLFDEMYVKIQERLLAIDTSPTSLNYFEQKFKKIKALLASESCVLWDKSYTSHDAYYMYGAGSYVPLAYKKSAVPVLTSMRNVDASCQGTISNIYQSHNWEESENVF